MKMVSGLDDEMKQRIIGAAVLLVLAATLLFLLLDFDGDYTIDTRSQIPPRPDIMPIEIAEPAPIAENEGSKDADQMFLFEESREEAENSEPSEEDPQAEEPPGLNSEGIPNAWILQVASFTNSEAANSLTEKLLSGQYKAFSRHSVVNEKSIYRVYVGPKVSQADLLVEKKEIEDKFRLKTLLLRFEP
jgi:DedD protein